MDDQQFYDEPIVEDAGTASLAEGLDFSDLTPELVVSPTPEQQDQQYPVQGDDQRAMALEAELAYHRQRTQEYEAFRQHQEMQAAQQQWLDQKRRVLAAAENLDPDLAIKTVAAFYDEQINTIIPQFQQVLYQQNVQQYADVVLRENGLSPEDRVLLGNDPNQMQSIAARLASQRHEIESLKHEVERSRRGMQATSRAVLGIDTIGGTRSGPAPRTVKAGSRDHLRLLLEG